MNDGAEVIILVTKIQGTSVLTDVDEFLKFSVISLLEKGEEKLEIRHSI